MSELAQVETRWFDDAQLVAVTGEVDLSNAQQVTEAISAAVPNDAARVVIDLSGTSYLDSAGVAMLFRIAERLRYRRQELRLVVPTSSTIRGVLELTNVRRVIPIHDELQAATQSPAADSVPNSAASSAGSSGRDSASDAGQDAGHITQ